MRHLYAWLSVLVLCASSVYAQTTALQESSPAPAQTAFKAELGAAGTYRLALDLNQLRDDKLSVTLLTPKISQKTIVYNLPKIVPGIYAVDNFGRFVSDFKAFASDGSSLSVRKRDDNRWEIADADKLQKITYTVDDTWDTPGIAGSADIFEPGGSSFDNKVFVLNTFALVGFFDGLKNQPFELTVTKPRAFYGATSLVDQDASDIVDTFQASSYGALADAPLMYHEPNTTTLKVGDTEIVVSVYSPNKKATSKVVADKLAPLIAAQQAYLGGILPVKKYAFLIYLSPNDKTQRFGALEHSYSSLYFMPEFIPTDALTEYVADAAAHEFFHIITPLTIHSEEIGDFDYNNPRMSKHLWLYEGLTEYAAQHAQLKGGLIDLPTYLNRQREKTGEAEKYNQKLPFTEMSAGVLDKYKDEYPNVYQKGALIGLCLDIKLRQLSGGKYGTQNLLADLGKRYGAEKSFRDEELFAEITKMTYPEVGEFFKKYVAGSDPLPLRETLDAVGIEYTARQTVQQVRLFNGILLNPDKTFRIAAVPNTKVLTKLAESLGIKEDDKIVAFNGTELKMETLQESVRQFRALKENDPVTVTVLRPNEKGELVKMLLAGKVFKEGIEVKNRFQIVDDKVAGSEKIALRNAWMK